MLNKIKHIISGNRKYYTFFCLLLLAILILGIISPVVIEKKRLNWENEIRSITTFVERSVHDVVNARVNKVLTDKDNLKAVVRQNFTQERSSGNSLFDVLRKQYAPDYSVEVFNDHEELIAWTKDVAIPPEEAFPLGNDPGEVHFSRFGLQTYLSVTDTLNFNTNKFFIILSLPIEKHYQLQNDYFKNVSLTNDLSQKYMTTFEIDYSPAAAFTKDGRKQSVEIKSNFGNRIAVVTFSKPGRETELADMKDLFIDIQSVLAVLALISLAAGLTVNLKKIKYRTMRFLFVLLFFAALRILLFILDIPSKFIEGPLTDASNFASSFGFGIVRSPLEFFITIVLTLLVCVYLFENLYKYIRYGKISSGKREMNRSLFYGLSALFAAAFLIELRGLGASLRSIIFDSSIRYFREPGLLPDLPAGLMQLNFLILGLSSVIVSISIVLFLFSFISDKKEGLKREFFIVYFVFQILGIIYDLIQQEPQGTPWIRVLYITLVFLLAYKILFDVKRNLFNYVYFTLISSIVTISLLNYYNTQLEKESLKTTAIELTRTNDEWLQYLVRQALFNASISNETIRVLKEQQANYETAAFSIWSQSSLQREEISSAITFLDRQKAFLGSFGINIDQKYRINPQVLNYQGDDIQIFDNYKPETLNGKIVSGIVPVREDDVLLGYVVASILYDPEKIRSDNFPGFLNSKVNGVNSPVSFDKLKVFVFNDSVLTNVYGDITPAVWHIDNILHADFSENNDAWISLNINHENYITYLLRVSENNSEKIIAVSLKEKNLSWSLYNFFKVFFIHSIFILALLLVLYIFRLQKQNRELRYAFRTQLLMAFLFISLLPMLLLAFYNRNVTEERNRDTILYKLKENSIILENYLKDHLLKNPDESIKLISDNASKDLNIEFSLFNDKNLYYSSKEEFYRAGLIPSVINPLIYDRLKFQGYKEYVINERIENFPLISFVNKVKLGNREFFLQINNAFNKIPLPVTGEEVDIFLFGSYFFATILVIFLSTILANRISSPIRSLTKATASVASGDLNFEIENNQKGEIRDLIAGFNSMIKELSRSQAELAEMEREIAWKEMARQVAHEIKNPLTPMKLAVQQLIIAYKDKSPKLDMIFDKVSQTIISQVETLNNIASEFSAFARMPKLKMENIDLGAVVDDACNLFIEENISIDINKDGREFFVQADKDQLKRAVINLIRNSMQAGADMVRMSISKADDKIKLLVCDNGRGIPEEHRDKIFQENFTTKEKGMGLGLKLAKKLMESINGSISVAETSSNGTKILLEFPVKN